MSQFDQVAGCECGSQLVVENDGIDVLESRLPIEIDERNGLLEEHSQQIEISPGRTVDDAGNLAFDKELQSHFFISPIFVGITDQDGVPVGSGDILNGFNDGRRKRVSDIGDDDADCPCRLGPERSSNSVHVVAGTPDELENALSGGRCDLFGAA